MPLQDLTPQLRTRLSKVERAVGWFVIFAALLLVTGFGYYAWHTAKGKGWFLTKVQYQTGVNNAFGLKLGDPVRLMGKDVGEITDITPNDPNDYYGMTVSFNIMKPHYGYIWSDSIVKVSADLFGKRFLEVSKGKSGPPTVDETNKIVLGVLNFKYLERRQKALLAQKMPLAEVLQLLKSEAAADKPAYYRNFNEGVICWIIPEESPALNERLDVLLAQVEVALPNVLDLTNRIGTVLDEGITAAESASKLLTAVQPIVDNLEQITDQIRDPQGSLGEWLIPADVREQLTNTMATANATLLSANTTLTNTDAQITALAMELERTLENLASITSNLNAQVAGNTNLVEAVSDAIMHADELVQGLKRHWFLRSAFKTKEGQKSSSPPVNPKGAKLR